MNSLSLNTEVSFVEGFFSSTRGNSIVLIYAKWNRNENELNKVEKHKRRD